MRRSRILDTACESYSAAGLYYYRARYYDPAVGRFVSEDPLRFDGDGTNFYAYVKNQSVRNTDPRGLNKRLGGLIGGKCCNFSSNDEW
jgi:RHS repeat-associated protein